MPLALVPSSSLAVVSSSLDDTTLQPADRAGWTARRLLFVRPLRPLRINPGSMGPAPACPHAPPCAPWAGSECGMKHAAPATFPGDSDFACGGFGIPRQWGGNGSQTPAHEGRINRPDQWPIGPACPHAPPCAPCRNGMIWQPREPSTTERHPSMATRTTSAAQAPAPIVHWTRLRGKLSVNVTVYRADGSLLARLRRQSPIDGSPRNPPREAIDWAWSLIDAQLQAQAADEPQRASADMTLDAFVQAYVWPACETASNRAATLRQKQSRWTRRISPVIGSQPMSRIGSAQVADLRDSLAKAIKRGLGPIEANKVLGVYSYMLGVAVTREVLDPSKRPNVPSFQEPSAANLRNKRLGEADETTLYAMLPSLPLAERLPIMLGLCLGLRPGEMGAIERKHYDASKHTLTICQRMGYRTSEILSGRKDPKRAGKTTVIDLSCAPDVEATIQEALGSHTSPWLFGCPVQSEDMSKRISAVLVRAGFAKTNPYCLRHACFSRMADAGVSLAIIAEIAGHVTRAGVPNIAMTARYLAPSVAARAAAIGAGRPALPMAAE